MILALQGIVAYEWLQYMPKIYLRCQGEVGIKHGLLLPGVTADPPGVCSAVHHHAVIAEDQTLMHLNSLDPVRTDLLVLPPWPPT